MNSSRADDDVRFDVTGLTVTPFDLPDGCLGGYYPGMIPLVPLWHQDKASRGVPLRIEHLAPAA